MLLLGILFLVITGLTWTFTGSVVSACARQGGNYNFIQGFNAIFGLLIAFVVFSVSGGWSSSSAPILAKTAALLLVAGFVNYFVMHCMTEAMKTGHNGIVWAICQSGTVCTFLMGVFIFGVAATPSRVSAVVLILVGIMIFGLTKSAGVKTEQGKGSRRWLLLSLFTFGLIGLAHCLTNIPSYWEEAEVSAVFRTGASYAGVFIGYMTYATRRPSARKFRKLDLKFALILLFLGIVTSYFLFYTGLDLLAKAGAGAIGYTITIGTCIAGFTLYSAVVLREKISPLAWVGFGVIITGILLSTI